MADFRYFYWKFTDFQYLLGASEIYNAMRKCMQDEHSRSFFAKTVFDPLSPEKCLFQSLKAEGGRKK